MEPPNYRCAPTVRSPTCLQRQFYRRGSSEEYEVEVDRVYHCDSWKVSPEVILARLFQAER